jgi:hypothetical protein
VRAADEVELCKGPEILFIYIFIHFAKLYDVLKFISFNHQPSWPTGQRPRTQRAGRLTAVAHGDRVFLGTCIDLSALHRSVYKQDPKEKGKLQRSSKLIFIFLEAFSDYVRPRRRSRFPIVVGHQSQTPQSGGRRGGLTARRISRVHCLPGASANSSAHDTSFVPTTGNPSNAQISSKDHLP